MGRMYTAVLDGISFNAVSDVFWVGAPADACVIIHEAGIYQDASETSEQLPIRMFKTATDNAANGTANTPNKHQTGDAAFGGTVRTKLTGVDLSAETTMLRPEGFNVLSGWHYMPTPECRHVLSPSEKLAIKLDAAPAAALTLSGFVTFEEIGG